jgi:hypothetical protein
LSKEVTNNAPEGFPAIYLGASQVVVTSSSSQQASSFQTNTSCIRLFSTQDAFIATGVNPTASNASAFLPGGIIEYIGISKGDKLAVIQASSSGTLYITEAL